MRPARTARTSSLLLVIAALCHSAFAKVIYVDAAAVGANDGTSWADAYVYLQDALADANESPKPVEIRVAQGTYKPDQGAHQRLGDREATFQLMNGVTLTGGFPGLGVSDPNVRDAEAYVTILSGDLNADDVEVADPVDLQDEPTRTENSFHVVTGDSTDETAGLDGFLITGGKALGPPLADEHADVFRHQHGGGMSNWQGSPALANCTFSGNYAENDGGGMYNYGGSPTLTNCTFSKNRAPDSGGMSNDHGSSAILTNCTFSGNSAEVGGAMGNWENSSPILTHCVFSENSTAPTKGRHAPDPMRASRGAGMCNSESTPILTNCTFSGNNARNGWCFGPGEGGGMYNAYSDPTLTNCTFNGNSADDGGGVYNDWSSNPSLTNCTFSGNYAREDRAGFPGGGGGGIFNGEGNPTLTNCTFAQNSAENGSALACNSFEQSYPGNVELTNCILWDGGDEIWNNDGSTVVITYSDIQGGLPGEGNIDADPLFADLGSWHDNGTPDDASDDYWVDGDYHVKSEAGRWDPNSQSWVQDEISSPCIDAGDPNSDWSGETWPHGERINMGAYGGTRAASMSLRTEEMSLARVAYVFSRNNEGAESFQSLLRSYGCPTTLIRVADVPATLLDSYDLVIVGSDTQYETTWSDPDTAAAIEDSGKPIVGLGDGGYDFFGLLGLSIGNPYGGHGSENSIEVVDPNSPLFSTPYSVDIPQDQALQLYTETNSIGVYLWPTIPETVTVFGNEVNDIGYYPLVAEHNRYMLWGFTETPQKMTEVGKMLFINIVIRTANRNWGS